jgi:hypothetical protein
MQGLLKSCDAAIKRGLARAGGATVEGGKSDQNKPIPQSTTNSTASPPPPERHYRLELVTYTRIVSSQCAYNPRSYESQKPSRYIRPQSHCFDQQIWHHYELLHGYKSALHHGYQKSELLLCKSQMQKLRSSLSRLEMSWIG